MTEECRECGSEFDTEPDDVNHRDGYCSFGCAAEPADREQSWEETR